MCVCPAKTRISLGIHPVWSESSLCAWRKLGSLATHWAQVKALIWVFAGRTLILLVLSCRNSHVQTAKLFPLLTVSDWVCPVIWIELDKVGNNFIVQTCHRSDSWCCYLVAMRRKCCVMCEHLMCNHTLLYLQKKFQGVKNKFRLSWRQGSP